MGKKSDEADGTGDDGDGSESGDSTEDDDDGSESVDSTEDDNDESDSGDSTEDDDDGTETTTPPKIVKKNYWCLGSCKVEDQFINVAVCQQRAELC
ncbi:hypothetical protein TELCIR_01419 [Teladorsagia circumcincta]|uniref:Uncharacterized protein n=1 Tax=Teladorsagia circumcincta TaxID=45464 RepID=A0A2G9V1Z0_TELCI|nr:hypothetical protein TELCIR_01419 [Teladorsagia circumcincta]